MNDKTITVVYDLHNLSDHTQPHRIIANYSMFRIEKVLAILIPDPFISVPVP